MLSSLDILLSGSLDATESTLISGPITLRLSSPCEFPQECTYHVHLPHMLTGVAVIMRVALEGQDGFL